MTGFLGRADGGPTVDDLTPESLRELLQHAAESVIVENPGWGAEHFAQAARLPAEAWRVEIRDGGPERHVGTTAANTDAVFDILRSWAAADGWWQEAFGWEPVDVTRGPAPGPD